MGNALRRHWPEYLMEAWGLGTFMVVACVFTVWLEHPASPARQSLPSPPVRRAIMGAAMGLTAMAIIYSPWGRQSGAHLNPAVTLAFLRLKKVAVADACFYIVAQTLGGLLGVFSVYALLGDALAQPSVAFAATVPGPAGATVAFVAEAAMTMTLLFVVLSFSNHPAVMRYTGVAAGSLVALYIFVEAPLSGMSINPARTLASAVPGGIWQSLWLYMVAPILGAQIGVTLYAAVHRAGPVLCAKLHHTDDRRCIFRCGFCRHARTGSVAGAAVAGP